MATPEETARLYTERGFIGPKGGGGKKSGPPLPDFTGLAEQQANAQQQLLQQQTAANRPNQSTPFASSQWSQGPDGQWSQQVGLNGPLAGTAQSLQQQAASSMGTPLNLSGLQSLTSGEGARQQAIDSAYGQATSRLNPMWEQRESQARTRLLNQGLSEGSAAWNQAMGNMGRERNDAYTSALASAIGQGTAAGDSIFRNNLAGRQQGMAEILRQRSQPMQELQQLQGLTNMPGFAQAGQGQAPNMLGASQAEYQAGMQNWQQQNQQMMDLFRGLSQIGIAGALISDERAKQNIQRLPQEVMPGVPLATWEWRPEYGEPGPTYGVIAQDLQAVAPELVRENEDGYLLVDYGGLASWLR